MVGFAGDTLAAVQIINAVDEYQTQYLTLEKVVFEDMGLFAGDGFLDITAIADHGAEGIPAYC